MEMKLVTYFMVIVEYRNLSKTANYLFVSQFTLSQFLAREGQGLGVKLVSGSRSELILTHAGELYEETCRNMIELQSNLYRKLSDIERPKTEHISIGITPQWGGEMFAEIYPIFKQKYPSYLASLLEDTTEPLLKQVVKGTLDIAILAVTDDAPASLPSVSVSKEKPVLAMSVSLGRTPDCRRRPGTALKALDISKVRDENLIISCSGTTIRDITNSVFEQYRISPRIIRKINSRPSSLKMVTSGLGATVIPLSCVDSSPYISYFSIGDGVFWSVCTVAKRNFKPYEPDHYLADPVGKYFVKERMGN